MHIADESEFPAGLRKRLRQHRLACGGPEEFTLIELLIVIATFWLTRQTDPNASLLPILTGRTVSNTSGDSTRLGNGAGHPFNGKVKSMNLLYGDGHVDLHNAVAIQLRYIGNFTCYNFY